LISKGGSGDGCPGTYLGPWSRVVRRYPHKDNFTMQVLWLRKVVGPKSPIFGINITQPKMARPISQSNQTDVKGCLI